MVLITLLIFIIAIFLAIIILIQNPKGGGLGSAFGSANQLGGVKRTADFLEKATWGLAIFMVVLCLASSFILAKNGGNSALDELAGEGDIEQAAPLTNPASSVNTLDAADPVEGTQESAPTN